MSAASNCLASLILRLIGWRAVFSAPPGPKSVIVVYPHTSNWDFPLGILFRAKHRVNLHWAGKDSLFRWPFGRFFVWLGGVPINRRQSTGMIVQLAAAFAERTTFSLCIAPEGTRARTDHWKSGFYRLALQADVPVGLAFIDYREKRVGVERWITLTGNEEADLTLIRAYYAAITPRHPDQAGEIRFNSK